MDYHRGLNASPQYWERQQISVNTDDWYEWGRTCLCNTWPGALCWAPIERRSLARHCYLSTCQSMSDNVRLPGLWVCSLTASNWIPNENVNVPPDSITAVKTVHEEITRRTLARRTHHIQRVLPFLSQRCNYRVRLLTWVLGLCTIVVGG